MALKQRIDELLQRAADSGDVPGVVALAIDRNRPIYEGAFGNRVLGQDSRMTVDAVFWLASMTKALTSAAAMQLVERGKLDLESPVSRWLPEIAEIQVLEGFDASGQPRTRPPKRPVTLHHLLTHTAGFGYEFFSAEVQEYQKAKGLPPIGSGQNAALRIPLLFDPGERWEYGISTDWAGKAIEAASGQRLASYLKEQMFVPLGMTDTAFGITASMRERLAKIHSRALDGGLVPIDLEVAQEREFDGGGGGLHATAGDYLRFLRMILERGELEGSRVLKPETVEMMARNRTGQIRITPMKSCMPMLSIDSEFFPGIEKHFSYGFQINAETAPTGLPAGGLMWAGLANTYFWADPVKNIAGVFMTQVLPFADTRVNSLFFEFQRMVYQWLG